MGAADGHFRLRLGWLTCGLVLDVATGLGFGARLTRTYTVFSELPVGAQELAAAGWTPSLFCVPHVGHMWTEDASGISSSNPLALYTTAAGQPAGLSVDIYGEVPTLQQHWFAALGNNTWRINIAFRGASTMCSDDETAAGIVGDRLVVNPGGQSKQLPLFEHDAETSGWHRGSCFDTMGCHYFFDTGPEGPLMSWDAAYLFPVGIMYHAGAIHGLMLSIPVVQQLWPGLHGWDPMPLTNALMCKNFCDASCTFVGTSHWSTYHIYFEDYATARCDTTLACFSPGQSCCPTDTSSCHSLSLSLLVLQIALLSENIFRALGC